MHDEYVSKRPNAIVRIGHSFARIFGFSKGVGSLEAPFFAALAALAVPFINEKSNSCAFQRCGKTPYKLSAAVDIEAVAEMP